MIVFLNDSVGTDDYSLGIAEFLSSLGVRYMIMCQ